MRFRHAHTVYKELVTAKMYHKVKTGLPTKDVKFVFSPNIINKVHCNSNFNPRDVM